MTTAGRVEEPSARYLAVAEPALVRGFELLATAKGGVAELRSLIQSLGVRGLLIAQSGSEGTGAAIVERAVRAASAASRRFRAHPLPVTEEEAPFIIPSTWAWTRFGDVADVSSGVALGRKGALANPVSLPYLRVANVQRGHLNLAAEVKRVVIDAGELPRFQLRPGDLLITEGGDWDKVGRTCTWRGEITDCVHQNHVFKARGRAPDWLPAWGEIYLNSTFARAYFADSAKQTTNLASINMTELRRCAFPVPPLAEQQRIVARVEELMKLCDALERSGRLADEQHERLTSTLFDALAASESAHALAENWQRVAEHFDLLLDRPEAIDALEQTILQLAVRGLLVPQRESDEPADRVRSRVGKERQLQFAQAPLTIGRAAHAVSDGERTFTVPNGWSWVRIEDVCEVQGGIQKTQLRRPVKNHFPYLRVANVQRDRLCLDRIERYELSNDEVEKWALRSGDLLVVEGNGSADEVGRCAMWDGSIAPCVFQNHLIRVRPEIAEAAKFIQLFLNSPDGAAEMKRLAITTSGLYNLSVGKIRQIPVPLPPLAEQNRIVARVEELRRLCADLRQRLTQAQEIQSRLADALVAEVA